MALPTVPTAQHAADAAASAANGVHVFLQVPKHWPAQTDLLTWCQQMGGGTAALLLLAGLIYLLFGLYCYKLLLTANALICGAYLGALIGDKCGNSAAGAVVGGFSAAALTWPLMKYAVALMGGVFGALLGASVWRAFGLDPQFAWAGGLSGLIFCGMLSFLLFRGSIM